MNFLFDYDVIRLYKTLYNWSPDVAKEVFKDQPGTIYIKKYVDPDDFVDESDILGCGDSFEAIENILSKYGCFVKYNASDSYNDASDFEESDEEDVGEDDFGVNSAPTDDYITEGFSIYHKAFEDYYREYDNLKKVPGFKKWNKTLFDPIDGLIENKSDRDRSCIWLTPAVNKQGQATGLLYEFPEGFHLSASATCYLIHSIIWTCEEINRKLPYFMNILNDKKQKKATKKVVA